MSKDKVLTCEVMDDELRISIGIDILKFAAEHSDLFYNGSIASADGPYIKVSDPEEFAKAVAIELNEEGDDGTTAIHSLLDKAIFKAFEYGCEGIDDRFVQPTDATL